MPTTKKEPPSTNRRVEELKQFLKPVNGLSNSESLFLHDVIGQVLALFNQTDGKERHFLTLVFTRESSDDYPLISMDTISSLSSRSYALSLVEEWIARSKADARKP
jgi:hypothetical protein